MPKQGYITPSTFANLMSNGKGNEVWGKTALKVIDQLVLDLLNVERHEQGTPASCQWGLDYEWYAIQEYEEQTFRQVLHPVEFKIAHNMSFVGGTMDGLVGKSGGIEVKCPNNSEEHLANLQTGKQLHKQYMYQVQGYFWIFELEWIDFISYDPRFPKEQQLYIERVYPNEEIILTLQNRCREAHSIACERVRKFKGE